MERREVTKTWKTVERRAAAILGTTRTPLSGANGGVTASDTLHPTLFIEVKHRARHAVRSLYEDVKKRATKERKTPILMLADKHKHGFLVCVHSDDITAFVEVLRAVHQDSQDCIDGP